MSLKPKAGSQSWNAQSYAANARFVSDLAGVVLAWLDPQPGERILDLGCGDGALTRRLQEHGCAVIGVDASAAMVAAARDLGLDARQIEGQALPFEACFEAVFSNAALHWMLPPEAVIAGVARALVPGGRFVAELGGQGNVAAIHGALKAALARRDLAVESDTYFPSPDTYRTLLVAAGFTVERIELIPRPTPLPGSVGAWIETFGHTFTSAVPADQRPALIEEVVEVLRPALQRADGVWIADYVRLRVWAFKPRG
jgi:SAM-dependent methyltransferase